MRQDFSGGVQTWSLNFVTSFRLGRPRQTFINVHCFLLDIMETRDTAALHVMSFVLGSHYMVISLFR